MVTKDISLKKAGRKKLKRLSYEELNNLLKVIIGTNRKIIDLEYKNRNFFITVKDFKQPIYCVNAKLVVSKINDVIPNGYKKYNSSREFLIEYTKQKLLNIKSKFKTIYNANFDDFEFYCQNHGNVLLRDGNTILNVDSKKYDNINKLTKIVKNK